MSSGSIFNSFSRIKLGLSIPSIKSHGVVKVDIKVVSIAVAVVSVAVKNQRKIIGILCDFILNLIRNSLPIQNHLLFGFKATNDLISRGVCSPMFRTELFIIVLVSNRNYTRSKSKISKKANTSRQIRIFLYIFSET